MKYISKCHNLVLTMKPNRMQIVDGMAISVPGEHVRFSNSEFDTEDKKTIEFLGKHRLKGTAFTESQMEMAVK